MSKPSRSAEAALLLLCLAFAAVTGCAAGPTPTGTIPAPPPGDAHGGGSPGPARRTHVDHARPSLVRIAFVSPSGEARELRYVKNSESTGTPTNGALIGGRCLPESGPGFFCFSRARCATDETIVLLMYALGELQREYPGTQPVAIGSLSLPGGGRLKPHKSHTSGRDVDIGFFAADGRPRTSFARLSPSQIDFDRTFYLMAGLIATGRVMYIFVNYRLQPYLYEAARRMGYEGEQLDYLFQYPRSKGAKTGVIRHARGHLRHFHVRFLCPEGDARCVE